MRFQNVWRSAAVLGLIAASLWAGQGGKIGWQGDYDQARAAARKDGKPLMLYFTAEW